MTQCPVCAFIGHICAACRGLREHVYSEQNYIDLRRTTSISNAWLLERTRTIQINVAHYCDVWAGDRWVSYDEKHLAIRFTRWIDADKVADAFRAAHPGARFMPTFHKGMVPLSSTDNPTGIVLQ